MKDNYDKYGVVFEAIRMDSDHIKLPKGALVPLVPVLLQ
jgi:hypothetical protein